MTVLRNPCPWVRNIVDETSDPNLPVLVMMKHQGKLDEQREGHTSIAA